MQSANIGNKLSRSFRAFAMDIKLSHSVFALPFVATGLIVGDVSFPGLRAMGLILVCMISARSFAMGMNRYLDADIDADNQRTKVRAIPSGEMSKQACLNWSLAFAVVFVISASLLSTLAGLLSVPLLVILAAYSFMKRWTWLTHWYLGVCLGLAPMAAQIALSGEVTLPVALVGVAVTVWTAGFDLLYSLQDRDYDKRNNLHSVPARLGPKAALILSIASFTAMFACLWVVGNLISGGPLFYVGVLSVILILAYEHWLVRDAWTTGCSKNINAAFFTSNAFVSVLFFAFTFLDRLMRV